ncbi:hypothetical protein [Streptomyces sp. NPDC050528]|uniref:hypothetical protein n=1 Tax=Streptomyces sp. NPDC050528 TaxID=3365623 RepID=UPI0037A9C502
MPEDAARPPLSLAALVSRQLAALTQWSGLARPTDALLAHVFQTLTEEALDQPLGEAYPGLSQINSNGLPFQWCLCSGSDRPSVRFLCESGRPGDSPRSRLAHTLGRLDQACVTAGHPGMPGWFADDVLAHVLPIERAWPEHWRSALWTGVGADTRGILLKPYLNLNRDRPVDRWRRAGRVLASLGRHRGLETLCAISGQVSEQSWPAALAVDILPGGLPGRVKIYFRSGSVDLGWLARWYRTLHCHQHAPAVRSLLDAFPKGGRAPYPPQAFVVTLEIHPQGEATLKTDLAVTRWPTGNRLDCTRQLLTRLDMDARQFQQAWSALGGQDPSGTNAQYVRFVGLGHEPDASRHVNVYVEPPPPTPRRTTGAPSSSCDLSDAITSGLQFLLAARDDGPWRDFHLPVGEADQWVTAYVLAALSKIPARLRPAGLHHATNRALDWLIATRTPRGGWGYNATTGDDADSTAWACAALQGHGHHIPTSARALLLSCLSPSGGVTTYPPGTTPGEAWSAPTVEVTPLALTALADTAPPEHLDAARKFIRARQPANGLWLSYWWTSPLYATREALSSMAGHSEKPTAATITALRAYAAHTPYERALLLQCRLLAGLRPAALELVRPLLHQQRPDGSWDGTACLRLTHPHVYEPWATIDAGPLFCDVRHVFTTATVLSALLRLSSAQVSSTSCW